MSLVQAHHYLSPKENSFWKWSADGTAIEWANGQTIAFREEIAKALHRLRPHGLASFDLIVLLLAACRESWASEAPHQLDEFTRAIYTDSTTAQRESEILLKALERISSRPELKASAELKAEMVGMILARHPQRTHPALSDLIVIEFDNGFAYEPELEVKPKSTDEWYRELRGLIEVAYVFDPDSVRLSHATGLTELPEPAEPLDEIEPDSSLSLAEFLLTLESDQELGGLARMARLLNGFIHLPRDIQDEEDLALGGVSDITNRGHFDRLLISELANDDDVLMNRVALNEALYLRRENSTVEQKPKRKILLDCGIRMWGLPRVFATSVALALAGQSSQSAEIYRAAGTRLDPVNYSTREGLIDHLARLELNPHPGEALHAFEDEPDAEQFYVLGEETLADEKFRQRLAESTAADHYVLTVNRSGRLRIFAGSPRGRRLVRESTLDLEMLFPKPHVTESLIDPNLDSQLPAIDRLRTFPLRLSQQVEHERVAGFVGPGPERKRIGALAITNDYRLMWWDRTDAGGIQLAPYVGARKFLCVNHDHGIVRAVGGDHDNPHRTLIVFDLNSLECRTAAIDCPFPGLLGVAIHHGTVMLVFRDMVRFFDGQNGLPVGTWAAPNAKWISNRFFNLEGSLVALSHNGLGPVVSTLLDAADFDPSRTGLLVFDSEARSSPVIADRFGGLQIPPQKRFEIDNLKRESMQVFEVDHQGNRIAYKSAFNSHRGGILWLHDDSFQPTAHAIGPFSTDWWSIVRLRSFRVKLESIAVAGEEIVLRTSNGKTLVFEYSEQFKRIRLTPAGGRFSLLTKPFERLPSNRRKQWSREAKWNDGSTATLDHRGLLHLKSSDPSVPEATLVLFDDHVSGWCSSGIVFGDPYFHTDGWKLVESEEVVKTVLKPFVWRLR